MAARSMIKNILIREQHSFISITISQSSHQFLFYKYDRFQILSAYKHAHHQILSNGRHHICIIIGKKLMLLILVTFENTQPISIEI